MRILTNICSDDLQQSKTFYSEFYGQRRFLVKDPNGCLIDICSPWSAE